MLIRVSYPLETGSPLYPGTPAPSVTSYRRLADGHASSSSTVSFNTHSGTHVDAPLHFCPGGPGVAELLGSGRRFSPLMILDLPRTGDICITPADVEPLLPPLGSARALFIMTGDWRRREVDPAGYAGNHPWIHPGVVDLLRDSIPGLQLLGTDTLSIASPLHQVEGRACHRSLLCGSSPILILEDLDLSDPRLTGEGFILHVYPWLTENLDGIPVVAIAEGKGT